MIQFVPNASMSATMPNPTTVLVPVAVQTMPTLSSPQDQFLKQVKQVSQNVPSPSATVVSDAAEAIANQGMQVGPMIRPLGAPENVLAPVLYAPQTKSIQLPKAAPTKPETILEKPLEAKVTPHKEETPPAETVSTEPKPVLEELTEVLNLVDKSEYTPPDNKLETKAGKADRNVSFASVNLNKHSADIKDYVQDIPYAEWKGKYTDNPLNSRAIKAIRWYQSNPKSGSKGKAQTPAEAKKNSSFQCMHERHDLLTCSEAGLAAYHTMPFWKASVYTMGRVMSCIPWWNPIAAMFGNPGTFMKKAPVQAALDNYRHDKHLKSIHQHQH